MKALETMEGGSRADVEVVFNVGIGVLGDGEAMLHTGMFVQQSLN